MEALELINVDMLECKTLENEHYRVSFFIRRHPEKSVTEDSLGIFFIDDTRLVLAVADGFGGQRCGEVASRLAIEALKKKLGADKHLSLREKICSAFEEANQNILHLGVGAASTLTVAELSNRKIRFYNAGDSSGMLVGARGRLKISTIQHNLIGFGQQAGLIGSNTSAFRARNNSVSNYLGSNALRIDTTAQKDVAKRDRTILVSDGILDNFDLFGQLVIKDGDKMCAEIGDAAAQAMHTASGKPDDLSILIVQQL